MLNIPNEMKKDTLVLIPARGGSKRIPHKNIKLLNGKPLICYSIDVARAIFKDEDICVSTDDDQIIKVVEEYGLHVPFIRPTSLSGDNAQTTDVVKHALNFFLQKGVQYQKVVLLQPTSPLRRAEDVTGAISLYSDEIDMVVSVAKSHVSGIICEENDGGFLQFSLRNEIEQKDFFEYNGAVYVINSIPILAGESMLNLEKKIKYVMPREFSVDVDVMLDWKYVEFLLSNK